MNNKPSSFRSFGQTHLVASTSRRTSVAAFGLTLAIGALLVGIDHNTGSTFLGPIRPSAALEATTLARHFAPLPEKTQSTLPLGDAA